MSNITYSLITAVKYYLLYLTLKVVFLTCYRIAQITEKESKLCNLLYQQNKQIFNNQSIELLSNQMIEIIKRNNEKNKSTLTARFNQLQDTA